MPDDWTTDDIDSSVYGRLLSPDPDSGHCRDRCGFTVPHAGDEAVLHLQYARWTEGPKTQLRREPCQWLSMLEDVPACKSFVKAVDLPQAKGRLYQDAGDRVRRTMAVFSIPGSGGVHMISLEAPASQFEQALPAFNGVLKTFKLSKDALTYPVGDEKRAVLAPPERKKEKPHQKAKGGKGAKKSKGGKGSKRAKSPAKPELLPLTTP